MFRTEIMAVLKKRKASLSHNLYLIYIIVIFKKIYLLNGQDKILHRIDIILFFF